jgi:hypothetical protein
MRNRQRAAAHAIISAIYTEAVENARRHYVQRPRPGTATTEFYGERTSP